MMIAPARRLMLQRIHADSFQCLVTQFGAASQIDVSARINPEDQKRLGDWLYRQPKLGALGLREIVLIGWLCALRWTRIFLGREKL